MILYRCLLTVCLVITLMFSTSCNTDSTQSVDYTDLSLPVQSLVETVLTYHAHHMVLDLHSDRSGRLSLTNVAEWNEVREFPSLQWRSHIIDSTLVHELFSRSFFKMDATTSIRVGAHLDRPFYIQENRLGSLLNGPVDLKIRFETYQLVLKIHYQDVFITNYAFDSELTGTLFYSVRFIDYTNKFLVQAAKGSVNFTTDSIQINDLEYRFSGGTPQHAQLMP